MFRGLRGLEALGGRAGVLGGAEGLPGRLCLTGPEVSERVPLAGPEETRLTQHKAERLRDMIIADCRLASGCLFCVPWVARLLLPSDEADRPSCSSSAMSCTPEIPSQTRNAAPAESTTP